MANAVIYFNVSKPLTIYNLSSITVPQEKTVKIFTLEDIDHFVLPSGGITIIGENNTLCVKGDNVHHIVIVKD